MSGARVGHLAVLLALAFAYDRRATGAGAPDFEITVELTEVSPTSPPTITPRFRVKALHDAEDAPIVRIGVRVAFTPLVLDNPVLDTSVVASDSAEIHIAKPLPSGTVVYVRGYARTATSIVYSPPTNARVVRDWLVLVFPGAPSGAIIEEQNPTFRWSGANVSSPPGPWTYNFSVSRTAGGAPLFTLATSDTSASLPFPLELNTSYRWMVSARLQNDQTIAVTSSSSFVIVDESSPRTTLLYQPFPSPFPSPVRPFACIWFDLAQPANVSIEILDIMSRRVRRLYPAGGPTSVRLEPGRYGRAVSTAGGCTSEFTWDGTDDLGRRMVPGVYLFRLRVDGRDFVRRVVFRG